jgi:hypothetical protein
MATTGDLRALVIALCAALAIGGVSTEAVPAGPELLRVGKSVPEAFSFVPLDVGMRVGLFRKYGIEIEAGESLQVNGLVWRINVSR